MSERTPPGPDLERRVAKVRSLSMAGVTLVVSYLLTRWVAGRVWPDRDDLSDIGTGFWRIGVSAVVAVGASLVVLALMRKREP